MPVFRTETTLYGDSLAGDSKIPVEIKIFKFWAPKGLTEEAA